MQIEKKKLLAIMILSKKIQIFSLFSRYRKKNIHGLGQKKLEFLYIAYEQPSMKVP